MKKLFIGRSPLTTLAGYILSALFVAKDLSAAGVHNWQDYLIPVSVALLGRLAGDDSHRNSIPPVAQNTSDESEQATSKPETFLRRGKQHSQPRGSNGRFSPSVA